MRAQFSKEWWKLPEEDGIWGWKSRPPNQGYGAVSLTKEPSHIMQAAGVLNVGKGSQRSNVDWVKARHYLGLGEKLRN